MTDNKEIEVKIKISALEYEKFKKMFKEKADCIGEYHQIDNYYSPYGEHYYDNGDRCLRVRKIENTSILSYKQIFNEDTDDCYIKEYETVVGDAKMLECILDSLNFKSEIVVDKRRIEFDYDGKYCIALDEVMELGHFIEIENRDENKSVNERNKELQDLISILNLDLENQNKEGYSNMIYSIKKVE